MIQREEKFANFSTNLVVARMANCASIITNTWTQNLADALCVAQMSTQHLVAQDPVGKRMVMRKRKEEKVVKTHL